MTYKVPQPEKTAQAATTVSTRAMPAEFATLRGGVSVNMRTMRVYLVGGAVRDRLLGLPVRERDWVVVGAQPAELERAGYQSVGREFPVFLHPDSHEEYALARLERKAAPGGPCGPPACATFRRRSSKTRCVSCASRVSRRVSRRSASRSTPTRSR